MDRATVNPIFVFMLFLLRCMVPILFMLGISYLLRRLGLIADPPPAPYDIPEDESDNRSSHGGGLTHGE